MLEIEDEGLRGRSWGTRELRGVRAKSKGEWWGVGELGKESESEGRKGWLIRDATERQMKGLSEERKEVKRNYDTFSMLDSKK